MVYGFKSCGTWVAVVQSCSRTPPREGEREVREVSVTTYLGTGLFSSLYDSQLLVHDFLC